MLIENKLGSRDDIVIIVGWLIELKCIERRDKINGTNCYPHVVDLPIKSSDEETWKVRNKMSAYILCPSHPSSSSHLMPSRPISNCIPPP